MYNPALGVFISRDPIGIAGGINLYEYCGDNSTNHVDPLGEGDLSANTDPAGLKDKEIVIFLRHFVPSKLTDENRAQAADIQGADEIEKALRRMKQNTKETPKNVAVCAVGCFQPSAKKVVDELFPGKWLSGVEYIKQDRLTVGREDVPIALQAYRLARQKKDFTLRVYANDEFRDAIQGRIAYLNQKNQQQFDQGRAREISDLTALLNTAQPGN